MKMVAHKFLLVKGKDKLLQLQNDVFMTSTGELVNNKLETISFNITPVADKKYEVVNVFDRSTEEDYIDLYQDELGLRLFESYIGITNANVLYNEEMDMNYIRFYTKPTPKELLNDK